MFIALLYKSCFSLSLLQYFCCYGNLNGNLSCHRIIMGKVKIGICRYFYKSLTEMFLEYSSTNNIIFVQTAEFHWLPWQLKGYIFEKYSKINYEYKCERADLLKVFLKSWNNISDVDKEKFFTVSRYTATRGHHPLKFAKNQHRLKVRSSSFNLWVIDSENCLPENVIITPYLNCFKSRLNSYWNDHPTSSIFGASSLDQTTRIHLQSL